MKIINVYHRKNKNHNATNSNAKVNQYFSRRKKTKLIIFRFVKCSNAIFEILILLKTTNINLKTFYSLNFNFNEKLLQYSRKANVDQAWLTNFKNTKYKQYRFKKNLKEVKNTIKINKTEKSINSVKTKTSLILSSEINNTSIQFNLTNQFHRNVQIIEIV